VRDEDEILWTMTDIPFPLFNSILRARLAPGQIDATIRSIITQVELQNVPLLWWTGPMTQPADLGRHLERHGFVNEGQMPGMAVELARLNESLPTPAELSVQRVTDDKSMKVWCQVGVAGFGSPAFLVDAFYDLMRASRYQPGLHWLVERSASGNLAGAVGGRGCWCIQRCHHSRSMQARDRGDHDSGSTAGGARTEV
jgi:hypothetical protein